MQEISSRKSLFNEGISRIVIGQKLEKYLKVFELEKISWIRFSFLNFEGTWVVRGNTININGSTMLCTHLRIG